MRFEIEKSELMKALRAARIADGRMVPLLGNVKITATGSDCRVSGADERIYLSCDAHIESVCDCESVLVGAKQLVAAAKAMPDGALIVTEKDSGIEISQGKARVKIPRLGEATAADFPPHPYIDEDAIVSKIPRVALLRTVRSARYAMANDWGRPHLSGILLALEPGKLRAVATDGHRLAMADAAASIRVTASALIPFAAVGELVGILESSEDELVNIALSARQAHFGVDGSDLCTQLASEVFPPYQKVIPSTWAQAVSVDASELNGALKRVSSVLSNRSAAVRLELERGEPTLRLASSDKDTAASAEDFVALAGAADASISVHVSGAYLAETLATIGVGQIEIRVSKELDPVVIAAGEDVHVIMPMRG